MRLKRLVTTFVSAAAMLSLFCCTAFAATPDHGHIRDQTIVSEQVTNATNENQSGTNTQFFLYIENPIEIGELPDTGDYGVDLTLLMGCAVLAGAGYLTCGAYADKHSA